MNDSELAARNRRVFGAIALGTGLPIVLGVALNFLRPDLIAATLAHTFGYVWVTFNLALTLVGTALQLAAALIGFKTRVRRGLFGFAMFCLTTLPLLFSLLFGPIVFAFMYGDAR